MNFPFCGAKSAKTSPAKVWGNRSIISIKSEIKKHPSEAMRRGANTQYLLMQEIVITRDDTHPGFCP